MLGLNLDNVSKRSPWNPINLPQGMVLLIQILENMSKTNTATHDFETDFGSGQIEQSLTVA